MMLWAVINKKRYWNEVKVSSHYKNYCDEYHFGKYLIPDDNCSWRDHECQPKEWDSV